MSDVEKELVEETADEAGVTPVEAEIKVENEPETDAVAEINVEADPESEVEAELGTEVAAEADAEVEAEVAEAEREASEPAGTALATPMKTGPTSNERIWAGLAHASVLLTFALGVSTGGLAVVVAALVPLAIWLIFRDRSRFVAFHAMQATVFQLAALAAWLGLLVLGLVVLIPAWIVTVLLMVVLIGFLLLPVVLVLTIAVAAALALLPFAALVYGLYGAFEVYGGKRFRYWLVADWIEGRGLKLRA
jgi:uncharacterized Tic20 family protein